MKEQGFKFLNFTIKKGKKLFPWCRFGRIGPTTTHRTKPKKMKIGSKSTKTKMQKILR